MKIGIYGGTFDPIHNGHVEIAEAVKREFGLDCIQFIVAADPPHKKNESRTPASVRLEMTKNTLLSHEGLLASDMEIRRGGVSYTVQTLEDMKKMYPTSELFFIMGADMLASFETWYMPEKIAETANLVAVQRSGQEKELEKIAKQLEERMGARVFVSSFVGPEISSTEIRRRILEAEPINGRVPYKTELFIYENLLYAPSELSMIKSKLEQTLEPSRLKHSLLTAREAIMLASHYGLDTKKARLCAILHDCAKVRGKTLEKCIADHAFVPTEEEKENPYMIHARLGALVAQNEYGVEDEEILTAIRRHTLGSADMTSFDKIIFLADKLEPSRDYRHIASIRKLAYSDLDAAVAEVILNNIAYNRSRGKPVHHSTYETLLAMQQNSKKNNPKSSMEE